LSPHCSLHTVPDGIGQNVRPKGYGLRGHANSARGTRHGAAQDFDCLSFQHADIKAFFSAKNKHAMELRGARRKDVAAAIGGFFVACACLALGVFPDSTKKIKECFASLLKVCFNSSIESPTRWRNQR